jgi:hypothetical protein
MAALGFLVLCFLTGYVWLLGRRVKDLEELLKIQGEDNAVFLRRIAALEKTRPQVAPALGVAVTPEAPATPVTPGTSIPVPATSATSATSTTSTTSTTSAIPPPPPLLSEPEAPPLPSPPAIPPALAYPPVAAAVSTPAAERVTPPPVAPPVPGAPLAPRPPVAALPPIAPQRPAPPPPPRPPVSPAPPVPPRRPFDWESLVGVKLFSWIAGILLSLAALQFLRYTIDHGWVTPPIRMTLGLLLGAGLLAACEDKRARAYATTANALSAAGIVILFSTLFAAHTLWHLLGPTPTFALMVLVTVVAVVLAIRHDSLFIALLGLLGGFATPALLSTGQDHPIGLFGYLLLLNAGLAWLALRKRWAVLSVLTLVFTTLYQWGWVFRFLNASKLPLALGIFLVFPILSFLVPLFSGRGEGEEEQGGARAADSTIARTAAVAAVLPLGFAFYAAATPAYGARFGFLFGFLFLLQAGLAAVAAFRGPRVLHPLAAGSTLLVFLLWFSTTYPRGEAWPAILALLSLFVLFDLAAPWLAERFGHPLGKDGRQGALVGPLLLFAFPVLFMIEPAAQSPGLPFAVLFALLAAAAGFALLYEQGSLHYTAAFFAIAAEAVWSARALTPERLLPGIGIYAVFGLFYLGVPLLARRFGRRLAPEGSGAFLLLLSLGLLFFLAAGPLAQAALWGMALLLVILNAGLFLEAGTLRRPLLALAGTVLSWVLIGVWWATVPLTETLVPALFLVAGFAVLGLVGNTWMQAWRRSRTPEAGVGGAAVDPLGGGPYMALVGHAFLFVVAAQPRLSIPPWPFLGVLAVLDLAAGVATLWLRRASLWVAALAASDLILFCWVITAGISPWPTVALGSVVILSVLAFLWIALARRRDLAPPLGSPPGSPLVAKVAQGAAVSLFLGQAVLLAASAVAGPPALALTVATHLAFLLALLALSRLAERPGLVPFAILPTTAAVLVWSLAHGEGAPWWYELAFAGVLYLPFLAFPLILGERARGLRQPWLAAVLASLPFFLFGRHALVAGGYSGVIGALPVAQAIALAILLARLVRLERGSPLTEQDRGRLALVAGAVLACITAAIPLQLDREWITIGWALLAAALAALYLRIPHRGLLYWTAGLLATVFVRLAANPAVLAYHPRGGLPILNWYLYTYLVPALAFFLAGWLLMKGDDRIVEPLPRLSSLAATGGVVLLFLLVNIEIADYFSTGQSLTFDFLSGRASLPEELAYTLGWAIFAIGLLIAGIALANKPARIAAILLLLLAVLKGFLHDLSQLGGLYRIGSLAGLAISLALMAVLLQKYVLSRREAE